MIIVGGVYYENCIAPYINNLYGSGGRAAAALSKIDNKLKLYSYCTAHTKKHFSALANSFGFEFSATIQEWQISFSYVHPLSEPKIYPNPLVIKRNPPIRIAAETVLRFGMLEGDAIVEADSVVYDPQDAYLPKLFHENGSAAGRLAIVLNKHEGMMLTGLHAAKEIAVKLSNDDKAEIIIIKMGVDGALVYENGNYQTIPFFKTNSVAPIGSGDIFSAVFAHEWAQNKKPATEAALAASIMVATYCESPSLPFESIKTLSKLTLPQIKEEDSQKISKVYLAGPFFSLPQLWMIEEARNALSSFGLKVFSPFHDIGEGPGIDVAPKDMRAIAKSDILFAILSGQDPGTIFEIGYARALNKPVIVFVENEKEEDLKMIEGSGCKIYNDFSSAIYNTRWAVQ